jgi:hypothetical protein
VPLIHSRCYLVKLHGDYLDTRIRNTDRELSSYSKPMNTLLDRIIDDHGLIVCGWSAEWDPALVAAISRAANRRFPTYWAARGQPSRTAQDVIAHRAAKVVPIDAADTFFEKLERMVAAQAELQKPNPRSMELLVGNTKKYLSRPEFRIQLADMIGEEVREATRVFEAEEFKPSGAWSDERFAQLVSRYEAVTEPLARILGVLGRWGGGDDFGQASELIARLGHREPESGLVVLIALRRPRAIYPALSPLQAVLGLPAGADRCIPYRGRTGASS